MAVQPDVNDLLQSEYTVQGNTIYWDVSLNEAKSNSLFIDEMFRVIPDQPSYISSMPTFRYYLP